MGIGARVGVSMLDYSCGRVIVKGLRLRAGVGMSVSGAIIQR